MQDDTPSNIIWQVKTQSSIQDVIGALNKPLNDHYKSNQMNS